METTFTPKAKQTRKQLAELIGTVLGGLKPTYLGAPTMAYSVGAVEVSRHWRVRWPEDFPKRDIEMIEAVAAQEGFEVAREGEPEGAPTEAPDEAPKKTSERDPGLTLIFPTTDWDERTQANLVAMLTSKRALIGKALDIEALPVEFTADQVCFPWFDQLPESEVTEATTHLLAAMIKAASTAKRVSSKPTAGPNEKYAMRCFLLRLGFIGDETKTARKVLMRNLDGNAAWANPPAVTVEDVEVLA